MTPRGATSAPLQGTDDQHAPRSQNRGKAFDLCVPFCRAYSTTLNTGMLEKYRDQRVGFTRIPFQKRPASLDRTQAGLEQHLSGPRLMGHQELPILFLLLTPLQNVFNRLWVQYGKPFISIKQLASKDPPPNSNQLAGAQGISE